MSYLEQQKQIEDENKELERRKIQDELEIQNVEAQEALETQSHLHRANTLFFNNLTLPMSYSSVTIDYKQKENVNNL